MIFRFVCDHDVDVAVAMMLRKAGHEAWTAADAGLYRAGDDDLTVYADNKDAVLISHDTEFSQRRRRNVIGQAQDVRPTPSHRQNGSSAVSVGAVWGCRAMWRAGSGLPATLPGGAAEARRSRVARSAIAQRRRRRP